MRCMQPKVALPAQRVLRVPQELPEPQALQVQQAPQVNKVLLDEQVQQALEGRKVLPAMAVDLPIG